MEMNFQNMEMKANCNICFWHDKYPNKKCPFTKCIIPSMPRESKEKKTRRFDFWDNGNFISHKNGGLR